ncbi:hypothetical protein, partial [Synechococcus lacustris]|uniref:hypothetical protein n=1 Tax=Synechococcus lacustris TaxID=2116544 RepID=UPI0033406D60
MKFYYKYIGEKPLSPFVWLCVPFLLYLTIIKKHKNMKKFEKVVDANVGIGNVINGLILGNMETDYTSYEI